MMKAITLSDGSTAVTMPYTRSVADAGTVEYKETTMASGRIVRKIIGFRPGFRYAWDYVPDETIAAVIAMLRSGKLLSVSYFDLDGKDRNGMFMVDYPAFELFDFIGGKAVWHNCALTIRAQGVS